MRLTRRSLALLAVWGLVLAGEVVGRWAAERLPLVGHVPKRPHDGLDAWPAIVIAAKVAIALLLARLAWRLMKAHRVASAGERALRLVGRPSRPLPAIGLSPGVWLASFTAMSFLYLVPTSTGEAKTGCWLLVTPWLHSQALPVFAMLGVVVASLWRTVSRSLSDLERYGERLRQLIRSFGRAVSVRRRYRLVARTPRALFGLAFESRPPPLPA